MTILKIKDLHCNSCISSIRDEIQEKDQEAQVTGDLKKSEVIVNSSLASEKILEIISEAGFEIAD